MRAGSLRTAGIRAVRLFTRAAHHTLRTLLVIGIHSCAVLVTRTCSYSVSASSGGVFDPGIVHDDDVGREPIIPIINAIIEPVAVIVNDSGLGELHSGLD